MLPGTICYAKAHAETERENDPEPDLASISRPGLSSNLFRQNPTLCIAPAKEIATSRAPFRRSNPKRTQPYDASYSE
ncbi:MAG: hypothetical protein AAF825_13700 [Pseudomonadota bacterium]